MSRPLEILIVEDNPADAFLVSELLQEVGVPMNISIAEDGQKALDILDGNGCPERPLPDLIVLDLNLPKVHGFDVLMHVRAMPSYGPIPVLVMTGSLNPEDETRARSMGATDYCIKPVCSEDFRSLIDLFRKCLTLFYSKRQDNDESNGR